MYYLGLGITSVHGLAIQQSFNIYTVIVILYNAILSNSIWAPASQPIEYNNNNYDNALLFCSSPICDDVP